MNKERDPMMFDIAKPEQARWLAILIAELQGYAVAYRATKDANTVYIELL